jgi:ferredoxin
MSKDNARPAETKQQKKKEGKPKGWWTGSIVQGRDVKIRVDWDSCMGSSSCVAIAPKVFKLDWDKKKSFFDPAPLELLDDNKSTDATTILP